MPYSVRETSTMSSESFSAPRRPQPDRSLRRPRRRPRGAGLRHGQVLPLGSLHARVAGGDQLPARRAVSLNTFYFQYGHRSIADLAHVALPVERLSLLAAIVLVDEQRWDGQERSTRYQNFLKSGWYFPRFWRGFRVGRCSIPRPSRQLFAAYQRTTTAVLDALRRRVARPETMQPEAYERTLKARAFDVARYLLPLATNTSLGQIVQMRGPWRHRFRACSPTPPPRCATWGSSCAKPPPAQPGM
jgi:hypothetical protein